MLWHKMFLIPLFCLNKYPLANIIKVYNKYKTPNPMVNSNLSSVVGWQVPARRGAMLWSSFPPWVIQRGRRANLLLENVPQPFLLPGEVPSAAAERLQRRRNRCLGGTEPCKAPEPCLRRGITVRKMTFASVAAGGFFHSFEYTPGDPWARSKNCSALI